MNPSIAQVMTWQIVLASNRCNKLNDTFSAELKEAADGRRAKFVATAVVNGEPRELAVELIGNPSYDYHHCMAMLERCRDRLEKSEWPITIL